NNLPIKSVNGSTLYIRDVAHVRDGAAPQTNMVRLNGGHAALMTVQKSGGASTLDIIDQVKEKLPFIRSAAPAGLDIQPIGDQSLFVKAAIGGVVRGGGPGAAPAGL